MDQNTPLLGSNRQPASSLLTRPQLPTWQAIKIDVKYAFNSSPLNLLLPFTLLGLIWGHFQLGDTLSFAFNFLGIIPLAAILAFATEELSDNVGNTLGALLNATFGNAVELIVSIIALREGQIRIVQASMLGSILSNLLLVLGFCFIFGGYNRVQQKFNQTAAQTMSSLLAIACASLLLPAAFKATLPSDGKDQWIIDEKILELSRGTSVIILIVYVLFLFFQLGSHHELFEEQNLETDEVLSQYNTQPTHHLSVRSAITFLVIATLVVSFCADYLVGAIDNVVESTGLSKTFIGLIIIPIVGNAAEHVTSVLVAMKDKMDLAIGVAIGSSLQIALFVTPFMVLVGWYIDVPMTLNFSTFETAILFIAVFLSNYLILDGESNWLEGVMSIAMYVLIALSIYYYPDTDMST
ncbi:hypothetical protein TBLA_0J00660 [Henningerozyma blattae CBS 6284]|uniref:Vacuolar calcium ion transporter n=1 Tax=Henningerozyma blattae (strain ATCC 34711 / CBS 6284 / DSM 70876 / NBRC 10599 / NRRL Y-10934 / UCD 77-7) TaxID=1071380 RepID=I2H9L4_HENB6|nr:hypothetical protein TBLA_0J00660 [Tetrapisispora blattae CBS 6284]CCH63066.1 hypothetical protein TBLA_0J00660 [Tetrapisispora blattae CBS 6284]